VNGGARRRGDMMDMGPVQAGGGGATTALAMTSRTKS